jgi:hypothetical protein
LYVTVVFGVAVNVIVAEDPEQIVVEPLMLAVGFGRIVIIIWSVAGPQLPDGSGVVKVIVTVPEVMLGVNLGSLSLVLFRVPVPAGENVHI